MRYNRIGGVIPDRDIKNELILQLATVITDDPAGTDEVAAVLYELATDRLPEYRTVDYLSWWIDTGCGYINWGGNPHIGYGRFDNSLPERNGYPGCRADGSRVQPAGSAPRGGTAIDY